MDGTGNPWFRADIAIKDGRIVKIKRSIDSQADVRIDASGMMVSPGFIDIHSHSDFTLAIDSKAVSKVMQGVTTEVNGNCGFSAAPLIGEALKRVRSSFEGMNVRWRTFSEYFDMLERRGLLLNVAYLVGHGNLRLSVMGLERRPPTNSELREMKDLLREAINDGIYGLSTGLDRGLTPGCFAETSELIELSKVASEYGCIYVSHIRNRQEHVIEAATEAIEIGKKSNIPIHISHFVPRFPYGYKTKSCIELINSARKRGIEVTCDVVSPCVIDGFHWGEGLLATQVLPEWAYEDGIHGVLEKLKSKSFRELFKKSHKPLWGIWEKGCWDKIKLLWCSKSTEYLGKTFAEIAEIRGTDVWEAAFDILLTEGEAFPNVRIIGATTAEKDILMMMKEPYVAIESDRINHSPHGPLSKIRSEPNSYGAFPRILERYVREGSLMTLEEAIRKMTSLPAQILRIRDRGMIREGFVADIVIFDVNTIKDNATLENPAQFPSGIEYVIVNGVIVVEKGKISRVFPGKVLRRGYN